MKQLCISAVSQQTVLVRVLVGQGQGLGEALMGGVAASVSKSPDSSNYINYYF